MPPFRFPEWLRSRTLRPRDVAPLHPGAWLELDRVRTVLSCVILAGLLALIIIGGRKTMPVSWSEQSVRQQPLAESLFLTPPY